MNAYKAFSLFVCIAACLLCISIASADGPPALPPSADHPVEFSRDIKPLFEASCIQCHAKGKDKGGFSLETRQTMLKGGDDGPTVVVNKSSESAMVKLVAGVDPDSVMPKKGKRWTAEQVGMLRRWIDDGAKWDDGVTFARPQPLNLKPRDVVLPPGNDLQPADRILATYFAAKNIPMPAVVDDRVFARRVYLDAIGLLPTPQQLQAFLDDQRADKRQRLVRTLLDDKRDYADHWLTFWNDLLRNDYRGAGFIDGGRRQISAWLYAALIDDKPYDQFVAELVNPTKASEGFSRGIIWRGAVNASQLPPMQAAQNISQVFMGVNLKCASCHDSFVSDWTLADAYGLAAVYSDDALELVHCDKPTGKISSPRFLYPQLGKLTPNAPKPQRLAELANLITAPNDGRLSRTIVNRLWDRLIGRGLVEPLDDMDKPAWSADMLDWLADDLVAHHYDLKHTIEVILTSRAYQLPSVQDSQSHGAYVFRGPQVRRLTAEQFCDALSSFDDTWPRMPATLQFDFSAGGMVSPKAATWIWNDEPVEVGQQRAIAQSKFHLALRQAVEALAEKVGPLNPAELAAMEKPDDDVIKARKHQPPKRHAVAFLKAFELNELPAEAFATVGASQGWDLYINGAEMHPMMVDGRVAIYDVKGRLRIGVNHIVLDVSSHTEKSLNDDEKEKYKAALNHLNKISGMAFYMRTKFADGQLGELTSDPSWQTRRSPDGEFTDAIYDATSWRQAVALSPGVTPIDEGPAQEPIHRKDFANEAIDVGPTFQHATTTIAQEGHIRAALLACDPLMTALDRPSREQVMTSRSTAATTLQALALTNGSSLDGRLKRIGAHLAPMAAKNPAGFVKQMYRRCLSRDPSEAELALSLEVLGKPVGAQGVEDFVWGLTLLPEFQFIE
ncbi:MAG TPA: DUF1549 domain-containing protein [Tepidisphaeraceae bacterium]|nr:DUF1549 domain-containing protein [Tepidisphaeraceae bacterium]